MVSLHWALSGVRVGLLEGCFDNKFEIRFRTQRPKADGRGMVDDFDVEVRNKNLRFFRDCARKKWPLSGQLKICSDPCSVLVHDRRTEPLLHPSS
jgi:hypothetical protein